MQSGVGNRLSDLYSQQYECWQYLHALRFVNSLLLAFQAWPHATHFNVCAVQFSTNIRRLQCIAAPAAESCRFRTSCDGLDPSVIPPANTMMAPWYYFLPATSIHRDAAHLVCAAHWSVVTIAATQVTGAAPKDAPISYTFAKDGFAESCTHSTIHILRGVAPVGRSPNLS